MVQKGPRHYGTLRYIEPDTSVPPEKRGIFSCPATKQAVEEVVELHDFRTSEDVVRGGAGIDAQGFTYVKHHSALGDLSNLVDESDIRKTYLPEIERLICELTGAKRAVVNDCVFRMRRADLQDGADKNFYMKRGEGVDPYLPLLNLNAPLVMGKEVEQSWEPARMAHVDYSVKGLRDSVRFARQDIADAGAEIVAQEDATGKHTGRYAVFSVWRPIATVKRDPLAVCDWRTLDPEKDLRSIAYRVPSGVNATREFILDAHVLGPPDKSTSKQKWYWAPEQTPEEVLIIKFADTGAEQDPRIARACPHISPKIQGTEDEEPRRSIEVRVFAFW